MKFELRHPSHPGPTVRAPLPALRVRHHTVTNGPGPGRPDSARVSEFFVTFKFQVNGSPEGKQSPWHWHIAALAAFHWNDLKNRLKCTGMI